MSRSFVPQNTAKMFSFWLESRNCCTRESTTMDYLDECFSTEEASKLELACMLSLFTVEAGWKSLPC